MPLSGIARPLYMNVENSSSGSRGQAPDGAGPRPAIWESLQTTSWQRNGSKAGEQWTAVSFRSRVHGETTVDRIVVVRDGLALGRGTCAGAEEPGEQEPCAQEAADDLVPGRLQALQHRLSDKHKHHQARQTPRMGRQGNGGACCRRRMGAACHSPATQLW